MKTNRLKHITTLIFQSLVILFFFQCHTVKRKLVEKLKDGHIKETLYWKNGNLKQICFYLNDSLKDGTVYLYDILGRIVLRENYVNGYQEGDQIFYFSNGDTLSIAQFKKGKRDGQRKQFYENHRLEEESFWVSDKPVRGFWHYYPNGEIYHYECYDDFGREIYKIVMDSLGNKKYEKGHLLGREILILPNEDSLFVGKEITTKLYLSLPPKSITKIFIGQIKEGIFDEKAFKEKKPEGYSVCNKYKFGIAGNYKYAAIAKQYGKNNELLKTDTLQFILNVKP